MALVDDLSESSCNNRIRNAQFGRYNLYVKDCMITFRKGAGHPMVNRQCNDALIGRSNGNKMI